MAQAINFAVVGSTPKGTDFSQKWRIIPIDKLPDEKSRRIAFRLNAFGSLFFFIKVVLRRRRLTPTLHKSICESLEKDCLKELFEIPRDHFKSTICSEGAPMWWSLPFTDEDEQLMRILGYGDEWIRWMRKAHSQDTRTLLVSENITNAAKLGTRISLHYENNDLLRNLFPEIIPDSSCRWSQYSMTHKRTKFSVAGEGTYDLLGVGGALQSRHYDRSIQDDLVGRDALGSEKIMADTIEYHKLLVGAFDSDPTQPDTQNDEIIVGNRWAYNDLNSYIRDEERRFIITTHSAEGGCCKLHPIGTPIFPEEYTIDKLRSYRERLGTYLYSCQYLNSPVPPGENFFKEQNLRWFNYGIVSKEDLRVTLVHEVRNGEVIKDILAGSLYITLCVDPNHSGVEGRCRNAIVVTGVQMVGKLLRCYLLEVWAESSSTDDLIEAIFKLVNKWKLREIWVETVAAQKYLKQFIEYRCKIENRAIKVSEFKADMSKDAKKMRIESLEPYFENGQFWINRIGTETFIDEYTKYPYAKTKDILDTLGYAPQTWKIGPPKEEIRDFLRKRENLFKSNVGIAGY